MNRSSTRKPASACKYRVFGVVSQPHTRRAAVRDLVRKVVRNRSSCRSDSGQLVSSVASHPPWLEVGRIVRLVDG